MAIGRPVIGEAKEYDIKVRVGKTTHEQLLEYCRKNKVTKAEAIRQGIKMLLESDRKE